VRGCSCIYHTACGIFRQQHDAVAGCSATCFGVPALVQQMWCGPYVQTCWWCEHCTDLCICSVQLCISSCWRMSCMQPKRCKRSYWPPAALLLQHWHASTRNRCVTFGAAGARMQTTVNNLDKAVLGTCERFEERQVCTFCNALATVTATRMLPLDPCRGSATG
jgi:hypothetical protein